MFVFFFKAGGVKRYLTVCGPFLYSTDTLSEKKDGFEWRNDVISDYGLFVMGKDF